MEEIEPLIESRAVDELVEIHNPRKVVADMRNFFTDTSLTEGRLTVTIAAALLPGIGRVENLQLLYTGKFELEGDTYVVTDMGVVNVSEMIRGVESVLDDAGL
jgi:hypothetical protein